MVNYINPMIIVQDKIYYQIAQQEALLKKTKARIRYNMVLRDQYREELENLISQFNNVIAQFKNAKDAIAEGQHKLRVETEKLMALQNALEVVESLYLDD